MKTTINVPYQPRASKNFMNRRSFYNKGRKYGLVREARQWRDTVRDAVAPFKGVYGADVTITFQIISNGHIRGDTANFVDLGCDGIATGLGLTSDHKFDVRALPRTREPVGESFIRITLANPGDNFIREELASEEEDDANLR